MTAGELAIDSRKTTDITKLSDLYAKNALPIEEYERLVEYINKIESPRELSLVEKMLGEIEADAFTRPYENTGLRQPASADTDSVIAGKSFKPTAWTILSSRRFKAASLMQKTATHVTILGDMRLDIGEGELPPGRYVYDTITILGDTQISVPPDVAVIIQATPILGDISIGKGVRTEHSPGCPEIVITGATLLGSINVRLRKEPKRRFFG
ncbi:MAG: cell wall-active antibiotics response protein [Spirochaetaceae bacterium]|jgi:hypothetical protein|nr:cell wall-active antibiotics response protein [Spirochaetaceae bacterium]